MPTEQANPPSKVGGALTVIGMVLALVGVGLMATVALTVPGVILLLIGLILSAISFAGSKAAARTPRA